jgi:hypothetical protein
MVFVGQINHPFHKVDARDDGDVVSDVASLDYEGHDADKMQTNSR